jgi:hypothetical protein
LFGIVAFTTSSTTFGNTPSMTPEAAYSEKNLLTAFRIRAAFPGANEILPTAR